MLRGAFRRPFFSGVPHKVARPFIYELLLIYERQTCFKRSSAASSVVSFLAKQKRTIR